MNRRQKLVQQQFLNNEAGVIRRLDQVYGQALKDIDAKIEKLMERFDPETGDLMQSAVYQIKYQKLLKAQIEGILQKMHTNQYLTVSDYLNECYEDGFIGAIFDQHGQGVPLMMPINQEELVTAVQLDSKISEGLYTRLGEDVNLLKKRITAQVSRGIATGAGWKQVAQQLANQTRVGYNRAIRIARTEGHRIQNTAIMNAAQDAKERGADLVKQWDATLDGKTRESHVDVDGEIRELNEKFSNGLEYPGDPAGGAAEVVNCRCVMLQRARWAVGGSFTKFNNFTKQLETFESPDTYDEFKKAFFSDENKRFMNYVQQMEDKYHTKNWHTILDQMSEREFDHYFKLMSANSAYNKDAKSATAAFFHDVSASTTKLKTAMGDVDYDALMAMVQANEAIAPLYDHLDEIPTVAFNVKKAEYHHGKGHLWYNYPSESYVKGGMSRYSTVSHEYGHFVDRFPTLGYVNNAAAGLTWDEIDTIGAKIPQSYTKGWLMGEKVMSNSDQFLSAMRMDFERIQREGGIVDYCQKQLYTTVGIQDAVDGYGLGRIWWGHGDKYYNQEYNNLVWYEKNTPLGKKAAPTKSLRDVYNGLGLDASSQAKTKSIARQYDTASELWANMVAAETTGGLELESIKDKFPETYRTFKGLLEVLK